MKKKVSVLLLVTLLAVLCTGCGASEPDVSPSSPDGEVLLWHGVSLLLESISDEAEIDSALNQPSGKYVEVVLAIQDSALSLDQFQPEYRQLCTLTCGGNTYTPAALISEGVEVRSDGPYAVGKLNIYFDIPEDVDISDAKFTMSDQPVTKPAK